MVSILEKAVEEANSNKAKLQQQQKTISGHCPDSNRPAACCVVKEPERYSRRASSAHAKEK